MRLAVLFLSFALLLQQAPAHVNAGAPALPTPVAIRRVIGRHPGPARAGLYRM